MANLSDIVASGGSPVGNITGSGYTMNTGKVLARTASGSGAIEEIATTVFNPMDAIGQIIYGGTSGAATKLAAGTAGQILVSGGAAAPVWTTGGSQLAGSIAVTGANQTSIDVTGLDGNTDLIYDVYVYVTSDNVNAGAIYLYINADTATTYYEGQGLLSSETPAFAGQNAVTNIQVGYVNQVGDFSVGKVSFICKANQIGYITQVVYDVGNSFRFLEIGGKYTGGTNLTSLRLTCSGGAYLSSGTYMRVYKRGVA